MVRIVCLKNVYFIGKKNLLNYCFRSDLYLKYIIMNYPAENTSLIYVLK